MGYASTIPYALHNICTPTSFSAISLHTTPYTQWVETFVFPTFKYSLAYAYLDYIVEYWSDDSAALNWINAGSFGIKDIGGTYHASGLLANSIFIEGNATRMGYYRITGSNNLAAYITSGATQQVWLNGVTCNADHLHLNTMFFEVRLIFGT